MRTYLLKVEDKWLKDLKIEAAKKEITMREYIIRAVKEKLKRHDSKSL
jgi:hypothetical protein